MSRKQNEFTQQDAEVLVRWQHLYCREDLWAGLIILGILLVVFLRELCEVFFCGLYKKGKPLHGRSYE